PAPRRRRSRAGGGPGRAHEKGVSWVELERFSTREIFLSAIRSEMDARAVYSELAARVKNVYLKEKLLFLAREEERHRRYLVGLYKRDFKVRRVAPPAASSVPMPALKAPGPGTPASEVIQSAMEAERAAMEFYTAFAARFEPGSDEARTLSYFAQMERGHYLLLESERELMTREEWFDTSWPMMHAGP
ncbi:MAG: ferritin-like domain-containing protein, partial [Thermoplasmatota archaeon]